METMAHDIDTTQEMIILSPPKLKRQVACGCEHPCDCAVPRPLSPAPRKLTALEMFIERSRAQPIRARKYPPPSDNPTIYRIDDSSDEDGEYEDYGGGEHFHGGQGGNDGRYRFGGSRKVRTRDPSKFAGKPRKKSGKIRRRG